MQQAVLSKRGIPDRLICSSSGDRNLAIRLADFPQPEAPGRDGVLLSAPYWDSRWKEPERGPDTRMRHEACTLSCFSFDDAPIDLPPTIGCGDSGDAQRAAKRMPVHMWELLREKIRKTGERTQSCPFPGYGAGLLFTDQTRGEAHCLIRGEEVQKRLWQLRDWRSSSSRRRDR